MARYWLGRSAGSWTARLAVILAFALVAGFTAAQQGSLGGAPASVGSGTLAVGAGAAVLTRPTAGLQWSFRRGRADTLEIRLDELMDELSATGRSVLDRDALLDLVRRAMDTDEPVEGMRLGDVLETVPRVRILTDGRSIVLGPRAIRLLVRLGVGRGAGAVDDLTVAELLESLPTIPLAEDGTPSRLDRRSSRALSALFGSIQKVDHARDPGFAARLELERQYEDVVRLVKELRLEGFIQDGDVNAVYDEAYNRLLASGREELIPLLDGHLRLEQEYKNADTSGWSHAERIQMRWEARRWAFGDETAALLFERQEAMERYQVDELALEADDYSAPRDKARQLAERREQLKVELARRGSYVGFPDGGAGGDGDPSQDRPSGRFPRRSER